MRNSEGEPMLLDDVALVVILFSSSSSSSPSSSKVVVTVREDSFSEEALEVEFLKIARRPSQTKEEGKEEEEVG
jgi:hypothetical protein